MRKRTGARKVTKLLLRREQAHISKKAKKSPPKANCLGGVGWGLGVEEVNDDADAKKQAED